MKEPAISNEYAHGVGPHDIPRTVLVVEDEPRLRQMLFRALPDMGFDPLGSGSGEEALRILAQKPISLIVLDLNLPGMHGLDLLETVRKRWPDIQVIILTGFGDLDAAKRAIHLDVVEFLTKPCTLGDLEISLDRAWRKRIGDRDSKEQRVAAHAAEQERHAPDIAPDEAPAESAPAGGGHKLRDYERMCILDALRRHNGNRAAAAAELGISVRTLYYRLTEYERDR